MPSQAQTNRYWLAATVAVAAVSLAYSVVILERILLGLAPVILVLILYIAWRALGTE